MSSSDKPKTPEDLPEPSEYIPPIDVDEIRESRQKSDLEWVDLIPREKKWGFESFQWLCCKCPTSPLRSEYQPNVCTQQGGDGELCKFCEESRGCESHRRCRSCIVLYKGAKWIHADGRDYLYKNMRYPQPYEGPDSDTKV